MGFVAARVALALAFVFAVTGPARASGYRTPESRMLMQIKDVAPDFGMRLVFQAGPGDPGASKAVRRLHEWLTNNRYPRISEFLQILSDDDVRTIYELFMMDTVVGSTTHLPLFEDLEDYGQYTPLALPFDGEWRVDTGHDATPHHAPDTTHRYAWDFIRNKDCDIKLPVNEDYSARVCSLRVPAPGAIISAGKIAGIHDPAADAAPGAFGVLIDHGGREHSIIRFTNAFGDAPAAGAHADAMAFLAFAASGIAREALPPPLLHYELNVVKGNVFTPIQARFAVYFARSDDGARRSLVISGIPAPGQYVCNVNHHLDSR
jgi:hypothetical protein